MTLPDLMFVKGPRQNGGHLGKEYFISTFDRQLSAEPTWYGRPRPLQLRVQSLCFGLSLF